MDRWLDRWLALVAERAGDLPILEIGCGSGQDTETLAGRGHPVVAFDLSEKQVEGARKRVPSARFSVRDIRAPFPVAQANVIVASLSLHYFPWDETLAIAARVRDTLTTNGVLLCRLNSTQDVHFGATGHEEIAQDYYRVDGEPKRFFDREAVESLFAQGWHTLSLEELTVHRYARPKVLWEIVVEKS